MPILERGRRRIRYELDRPAEGPADGLAYVLVNGLTQYIELWEPYRYTLVANGFRVLTFDLLGQGVSDKPTLNITQDDQVAVLHELIGELGPGPVFVAGISFGGVIALRYAIAHSDSIAGLVPISAFAELPPQLYLLGTVMRNGLILGGTSFLMDLLFPMNLSNDWLAQQMHALETAKRRGWLLNDVYALQNLMESFLEFEPMTPHLSSIRVPTMILNGEFDFLTPRPLQDSLRVHIPNSELVFVPRAYHAFTLEKPVLTADYLARFARDVIAGRWRGKQTVWIGPEEPGGEFIPFPADFDHMRAIPIRRETPQTAQLEEATPRETTLP
jgi:pimeloyl-ACP methyl ester carboxylesterase